MPLFFKIKDLWVAILHINTKNSHFSTKKWPKVAFNGQNLNFFICILHYPALRVFSLKIRNYEMIYCQKHKKITIFHYRMAQKLSWMAKIPNFFFIDPIWLCLMRMLIGMRLFFFIKELRGNFFNQKLLKWLFFNQKWPLMAKIPKFLYWSNMIMPYEYPVNWDALILLYQGTTSRFIEWKL